MLYDNYVPRHQVILEKLREDSMINLYPEEKEKIDNPLRSEYSGARHIRKLNERYNEFVNILKEEVFTEAYYQAILEPVLENQMSKSRSFEVGWNLLNDYVKESGYDNLINKLNSEDNLYLYELTHTIESTVKTILNEVNTRIKEGLSEDDVFNIEHGSIKSIIKEFDTKFPTNIMKKAENRVEKGISDFVLHQKDSMAQIQSLYNKTKEKIDNYDMAKQSMMDINTMDPNQDQDLMNDSLVNPKMDNQQDQETMSQLGSLQMEAYSDFKRLESKILEENYNIFEAIVRILTESSHVSSKMKSMYNNFNILKEDAKVMYTLLECLNVTNVQTIDDKYLKSMLEGMENDIMNIKDSEAPSASSKTSSTKPESKSTPSNSQSSNSSTQTNNDFPSF